MELWAELIDDDMTRDAGLPRAAALAERFWSPAGVRDPDARVLQAIRAEHDIVPKIERWRELSTLIKTYLDVLPELVDERSRIHTTFLQAGRSDGAAVEHQPEHAERPDPHAAGARDPRLLRGRAGRVLISADYSQIELRVLAHVADEPCSRRSSSAKKTCTRRPPRRSSRSTPTTSTRACARRPR